MKVAVGAMWAGILVLLALTTQGTQAQSIDELIAGSYTTVDEFDRLADISGQTIRHELDMLLTREQAEALKTLSKTDDTKKISADAPNSNTKTEASRKKRKAIRALNYRWTNKRIPYSIAGNVFSASERAVIMSALKEWQDYTCVTFTQATRSDANKIHFDNGNGCYSYVGMVRTGSQKIGLAKGCRFKGIVIHEVGHAVGFHHEQNRPDRDDYITINENNIPANLLYNFKKYPASAVDTMGVPYDYGSVMHYGGRAFSQNGQYTIQTKNPADQNKIGKRKGLSFNDIMLANKMYKCNERCDQNIKCPAGGFLGKDCRCWCPGYPVTRCASTGTVPTTTAKPTDSGITRKPCRDLNTNCPGWASAGYCARNSYVKTYCKSSCGFCSDVRQVTTPAPCVDLKEHCAFWDGRGYCTGNFESFMSENCPKTCKVCGAVNRGEGRKGEGPNGSPSSMLGGSVVCSLMVTGVYSLLKMVL